MSPAQPYKILVVDDEENVRNAIRRALRREGYELFLASDASEGLALMKDTAIDLVISDHLMPNMTGLEFLKKVGDRRPDCVRIMLTGYADIHTAIDAINHGHIYRFLTKPWDDTELKVLLHTAFEQLELVRTNRRLLAKVRRQYDLLKSLEQQYPEIAKLVRDAEGAIVIDEDDVAAPREDPEHT
jgi:DNA-binding NtrC family response regulator